MILEFPLAVKLGTITKDGKADVFSYPEDDMVIDPNLTKHLSHFGINISAMEKVLNKIYYTIILFVILLYNFNNFIIFYYRLKNQW